jgi:DNA-binding NarL/FixJ family response regulator
VLPKVFIVDGHPLMRFGLEEYLGGAGVRVVGESGGGGEAFDLVRQTRPDAVVLGLNLVGEPDGVDLCRLLKSLPRPPRVLVHTAYNLADDVTSCFLAGADGFLHKSTDREQLLDAVRRTAAGERVWLPGARVGEPRSRLQDTPAEERLTPREREVLALMLRRYSNADVAGALHISAQTAKNHASKVLRKLGMRSRKELFSRSPVLRGVETSPKTSQRPR